MKFDISISDLQGKIQREEEIIISDAAGNLYKIVKYIKPIIKDD